MQDTNTYKYIPTQTHIQHRTYKQCINFSSGPASLMMQCLHGVFSIKEQNFSHIRMTPLTAANWYP